MTRKLKDKRGSVSIFTMIFVMVVLLFTVMVTTFVTSYITYDRLITEVEQNLNDSAAKAERAHLFLTETDQGTYSVDSDTLAEAEENFKEEFMRNLKTETEEWTISNIDLQMYQSTGDTFAVLHRLTCNIVIKVSLFGKGVGVINKDIAMNGRHNFADITSSEGEAVTGDASQDTGTLEPVTQEDMEGAEDLGEFVEDLRGE